MSFSNRMARVKVQGGVANRRSLVPLVKTRDFGMTPTKKCAAIRDYVSSARFGRSLRISSSRSIEDSIEGQGRRSGEAGEARGAPRPTHPAFRQYRCNRREGPCKASLRRRNNLEP